MVNDVLPIIIIVILLYKNIVRNKYISYSRVIN